MKYYSILLDLKGRSAVVVGGGSVAERKVLSLIECSADITVISPDATPVLKELSKQKRIRLLKRDFTTDDLNGALMVIAATSNRKVNTAVSYEAKKRGILVNVVDVPEECSFIVPSVVQRGDLLIAISTSGKSPAMAKKIRVELESLYGKEYELFLSMMGEIRARAMKDIKNESKRQGLFSSLVSSDILKLLKEGKVKEAEEEAERIYYRIKG
ncbi:MAG: bifunctional precorrin-2 dehydrogenase/sirohydrochlorin ferrochelatase [Nitrospirota bacterium]